MALGFPIQLISKVLCTRDGGALQLDQNCQLSEDGGFVRYGTLCCRDCSTTFAINDGILNMLNPIALDDESKHELLLRNKYYGSIKVTERTGWENEHNSMELLPMVEALSVGQETTMLELGCGDGRYTVLLVGQCRWIVAIDFSLESLRILQQRLQDTRNVALVAGDITTMRVSAASFDRVLSTLVSNLPTREHRNAMYRLAAIALRPNGRFVFGAHHHGFRQWLEGEEKSGRYYDGGIYRYNFSVTECKKEVQPYFKVIKAKPIQIYFPFGRALRMPLFVLSRVLERIPLINKLGELILCTAEGPI